MTHFKKKKASAKRFYAEGRYSDIAQNLDEWLKAHDCKSVVAYVRVSDRSESYLFPKMVTQIVKTCESLGIDVAREFYEVRNGRIDTFDGSELERAVQYAKSHDIPIVVYSAERLLRRDGWTPKMGDALPRQDEFEQFNKLVDGVTLLSIIHPDTSHEEKQRIKRKMGKATSRKRQGRPVVRKKNQMAAATRILKRMLDGGKLVWRGKSISCRKLEKMFEDDHHLDCSYEWIRKKVHELKKLSKNEMKNCW